MAKQLFFIADDGVTGREPYVTDGGTIRSLGDMNPGEAGSNPGGSNIGHAVSYGSSVLFVADDGLHGEEFWITDGTVAGTRLIVDFVEDGSNEIRNPVSTAGLVWFNGGRPETGNELHVTDGTAAGTRIVADLNEGEGSTGTNGYVEVNGEVVFQAILPPLGPGLWATDGTAGGTRLLAAIGSHPEEGATLNDILYFMGDDDPTGNELWRTNGTEDGTYLVADIFPDDRSSFPQNLVSVGGHLLFTARDEEHGDELWRSDGTGAGTFMVRDINADEPASNISPFGVLPDRIVFTATDGSDRDLWVSDGTFGGTTRIGFMDDNVQFPNFSAVGDGSQLVFRTRDGLWVTDGTAGGTSELASGLDISGSEFSSLTTVGELVFFAADDGIHGNELWVTDGTVDGTRMVADMTEGPEDSTIDRLTAFDFAAPVEPPIDTRVIEATEAVEVHDLSGPGPVQLRGTPTELNNDRITQWELEGNFAATVLLGHLFGKGAEGDLALTGLLLVYNIAYAQLSIDTNGNGAYDTEITIEGDLTNTDFAFEEVGGNTTMTLVEGAPTTPLILQGTPEDNTLTGREAGDRIDALGGNDLLRGMGGNDTLSGGDGTDTINGGDGDDNIQGGTTETDLRDVIFAGAGNDSVDAGAGNDLVYGQDGNDTIAGGFGVDELLGQNGDDVITGSAFSDLVFGGAGNDFVNGGFGSDRINGGSGADKFFHVGVEGHGSDWVQDYVSADGDVLLWGGGPAIVDDFQVNLAHTANAAGERSGDDTVQEAFVIYKPTEQIIWALVDGGGQSAIDIQISGGTFDLLA